MAKRHYFAMNNVKSMEEEYFIFTKCRSRLELRLFVVDEITSGLIQFVLVCDSLV